MPHVCKLCGKPDHYNDTVDPNGNPVREITICPVELAKAIKFYMPNEVPWSVANVPDATKLVELHTVVEGKIVPGKILVKSTIGAFYSHLFRYVANLIYYYQKPFKTKIIFVSSLRDMMLGKHAELKSVSELDKYDLVVLITLSDGMKYTSDPKTVEQLIGDRVNKSKGIWVVVDKVVKDVSALGDSDDLLKKFTHIGNLEDPEAVTIPDENEDCGGEPDDNGKNIYLML